jgi:hypothetical protein
MVVPHGLSQRQSERRRQRIRIRSPPSPRHTPGDQHEASRAENSPAWRIQAAGTPAPSQTLQYRVLTPSASSSRATARASCALPRLATSQHLSAFSCESTARTAGALPPRLRAYSCARMVCPGPGCAGSESVCVRKSVPAATTRRGRVGGGRGVGVGDGRRRDMMRVRQAGASKSQSSSSSSSGGELTRAWPAVGAISAFSGRKETDAPRHAPGTSERLSIMATTLQ